MSNTTNTTKYGLGSLENNLGNDNTGIGAYAAYNNLDASNNTAIGSNSAFFNTTGSNNTSLGAGSICNNTTGALNTAIGSSALEGIVGSSVGNENTAVGAQSLYTNQGSLNTAIGTYSALGVIGGNYNTFLGANTSTLSDINCDYSTAIGYNAKVDASNQIMMGGNNSPFGYPNVIIPGKAYLPNFVSAGAVGSQLVTKAYVDSLIGGGGDITPNSIIITPTNPGQNNPTAGITNTWNTGGLLAFTGSGGLNVAALGNKFFSGLSVRLDSWTATVPGASFSLFEINFTFNNTSNWGQTRCYLQVYPNRLWNNSTTDIKWAIDNTINGDKNYSVTDATYAPSGRWYWTYNQNFSGITSDYNAWLVPFTNYINIYFRLPDNSYDYECVVTCLDATAMTSANRSWQMYTFST